ncbi:hypothetical protein HDU92_003252 [Lobulomyces angularis]|nr:hypothetical protein HDU92_003252 [Lobulomyces angularis]
MSFLNKFDTCVCENQQIFIECYYKKPIFLKNDSCNLHTLFKVGEELEFINSNFTDSLGSNCRKIKTTEKVFHTAGGNIAFDNDILQLYNVLPFYYSDAKSDYLKNWPWYVWLVVALSCLMILTVFIYILIWLIRRSHKFWESGSVTESIPQKAPIVRNLKQVRVINNHSNAGPRI